MKFKMFSGNIDIVKEQMNAWLQRSPLPLFEKVCVTYQDKSLRVLVSVNGQEPNNVVQQVEFFVGEPEQVEKSLNEWGKHRHKVWLRKMRMVKVDGLLLAMIIFAYSEPEAC